MKSNLNSRIALVQSDVEEMARILGGYWPALSGLARVLEELGELAELILKNDFSDEFAAELSDVLVITICVSNQFCAMLQTSELTDVSQSTVEALYLQLAADCGEFSRIVNAYEGSKKLKPTENPKTIEKQGSLIVYDILSIAQKIGFDVLAQAEATLEKVKKRDRNRFDTIYDPVSSENHNEYMELYPTDKKIWGMRKSNEVSLQDDLSLNEDTLKRFMKFGPIEAINKLVIKIPHSSYNISITGVYAEALHAKIDNGFVVLMRKNPHS